MTSLSDWRFSVSLPVITFLIALGVYLMTLAPDLTHAHFGVDGGELIAAAATLGIPHPPGYPTYTILGHLISHIPLGTLPFRFNLFSAVSMAVAAAFVTAVSTSAFRVPSFVVEPKARNSKLPPIAAGLTFAFAQLVWSQAVITEVYALNLACLGLFLWLLLTGRPAFWVGLALGLSLTTHLTSGLMLPLAIWGVRRGRAAALLVGLCLGITPYLLLPLLAQNPTPVIWGDPTTLSGWWWLVSGRLFASNVLALPLTQWPTRLAEWGVIPFIQFTPIGLPLLLYGLYLTYQGQANLSPKQLNHASRLTYHASRLTPDAPLLLTALAYFLYAFTYTSKDAIIFLLPGLLLLSIVLTFGLIPLKKWAFILPLTLVALNFGASNLRQEVGPRPRAEQLLQAIPTGAVVLTPGDETLFTFWALQQGEGQRNDLILIDANLFAFDWYRQRLGWLYPQLTALEEDDLLRLRQENQSRQPFCLVSLHHPTHNQCDG